MSTLRKVVAPEIAAEHGFPPGSNALCLKLELWDDVDVRLAHAVEWIAEDADDAEVRQAVHRIGRKLRRMLEAHRPSQPQQQLAAGKGTKAVYGRPTQLKVVR